MRYADCIISGGATALDRSFTYIVPDELSDLRVGEAVKVPFGRNSVRDAYVLRLTEEVPEGDYKWKKIISRDFHRISLDEKLLKLSLWMKNRYGGGLMASIQTVLPVKEHIQSKSEVWYHFVADDDEKKLIRERAEKRSYHKQLKILDLFENTPVWNGADLSFLEIRRADLLPFLKKSWIKEERRENDRLPELLRRKAVVKTPPVLNDEQETVFSGLKKKLTEGGTALLHGITGSGKTEIYLRLVEEAEKAGKQSIVLIPEISLTYQTVKRFTERFSDRVAILHSKLSDGEKHDQLERARKGELSIMIGPRSALFTPFQNLGLVIIDEEQEDSYRSDKMPCYNALEVAEERMREEGGLLLLGSATPSVRTFERARRGEIAYFSMRKRAVKDSRLAHTEIVDLRKELQHGNRSIFSKKLQSAITERLEKGEQTILFLNRRGFARTVLCRDCGESMKCPHCEVTLTFHLPDKVCCHYCGYEARLPKTCPSCGSRKFAGFGLGTEKVEESLHALWPEARVLRMDADTTKKKGSHEAILQAFEAGEADILIGTQMVVKGHDYPRVTLVGILCADLSLHYEDYLAAERSFQLLCQAAGRAGRGKDAGEVLIQTYEPEHYAIYHAARQDYEAFFEAESKYRAALRYPPYTSMLRIFLRSNDPVRGWKAINDLVEDARGKESLEVLGPSEDAIPKIKDAYRFVCYIKSEHEKQLIALLHSMEEKKKLLKDPVYVQYVLEGSTSSGKE